MESLKLDKPAVIEVIGLPGSGKSFFAMQFANTFGAAIVSNDKIRWTLFANHTYSKDENQMVEQVADLTISELLKTKRTFILDGGCNTRIERENIEKLAKRAGFQVIMVVVQVDEQAAKRRATKRNEKNPGDIYKQSIPVEEFEKTVKSLQLPAVTKKTVVISGKHTYSSQARAVLKKILELQEVVKPAPAVATPIQISDEPKPVLTPRPAPILRGRGPFVQ
ncbi:MAG: ATP-binding protein [Candidatus Nomurabacteria bacterium]|nr:ATP-binding protein [Candidatus Nomurabacteria bacterium]